MQTILLSKYFNNDHYTSLLVGGGEDTDEKSMRLILEREQIPYLILPDMGRDVSPFSDIVSLWKIYRLLRREKPDIVHTHTAKAGAIGRMAAFMAGVPVIIHTFHGHIFHSYFPKWKSRLFSQVERFLSKLSNAIIVISKRQYNDIVNIFKIAPAQKVYTIPLGFDWDAFDKEEAEIDIRKKYNIPENKKIITIIGRLVPIKNVSAYIRIVRKIEELAPDSFHFLIIGDGELRGDLELLARQEGISDHLTFTGWLHLSASVYHQLDLVMLTSLNEGTPVTLIEALACGIPCLATDVGGVGDIFELYNSKSFIDLNAPGQVAKHVIDILKTGEKPDSVKQSRIRSFYSAKRLVVDIENLYLKLLSHNNQRGK